MITEMKNRLQLKLLTSIAATMLVILPSLGFAQETRFLGWFDGNGEPIETQVTGPINRKIQVVPPGHTVKIWPDLPLTTRKRMGSMLGGPIAQDPDVIRPVADERFAKSIELLKTRNIVGKAKKAAATFNVDPAVLIASILGELTFNNDTVRLGQDLLGKFIPSQANFSGAARIAKLLDSPQFAPCEPHRHDYWSWNCMNAIWGLSVGEARGLHSLRHLKPGTLFNLSRDEETLHGVLRPSTGTSYGLAQISLVRALMISKELSLKTNLPHLTIHEMADVMEMILNDEATLYILAASTARSIDVYKRFAGFDISKNLGLQVTLFNLGFELEKARTLDLTNQGRARKKLAPIGPKENYMGWYMTEKEAEIRAFLNQ